MTQEDEDLPVFPDAPEMTEDEVIASILGPDASHVDTTRLKAEWALAAYYAAVIRQDDDPDHGGPEDVGMALARRVIMSGDEVLATTDWREMPGEGP